MDRLDFQIAGIVFDIFFAAEPEKGFDCGKPQIQGIGRAVLNIFQKQKEFINTFLCDNVEIEIGKAYISFLFKILFYQSECLFIGTYRLIGKVSSVRKIFAQKKPQIIMKIISLHRSPPEGSGC
jgi:hypothetical protein